jgi:CHAT domain-containing protein
MVSQPNTPGMVTIPFARDEVEKVRNQITMRGIPSSTLNHEQGTVNRFLDSMGRFSSVHLACHASQDMANPLRSAIYLHDRPLELSEIIKKDLRNADFAFLSACQTSQGDRNLPEEAVHIASGMLAAGYRSVVGTMWSIFDIHGPDVAEYFYDHLIGNATAEGEKVLDSSGAARALHKATKQLREDVSDSDNSFLAWVPYIHIGI